MKSECFEAIVADERWCKKLLLKDFFPLFLVSRFVARMLRQWIRAELCLPQNRVEFRFLDEWLHILCIVSFLWLIDVTHWEADEGKALHNGRKSHGFSITKASRVKQQHKSMFSFVFSLKVLELGILENWDVFCLSLACGCFRSFASI